MFKKMMLVLAAVAVLSGIFSSAADPVTYRKISSGFDFYSASGKIMDIATDTAKNYVYLFHYKDPLPDRLAMWDDKIGDSIISRIDGQGKDVPTDKVKTFNKGHVCGMDGSFQDGIIETGMNSSVITSDTNFTLNRGHRVLTSISGGGPVLRRYDQNLDYIGAWAYPIQKTNIWFYVVGKWDQCLASDKNGNIYYSLHCHDLDTNSIYKFSSDGTFIRFWGMLGKTNGKFDELVAIVVDKNAEILYALDRSERMQKFSLNGTFKGKWIYQGGNPIDMTIDPRHHELFVSDGQKVHRYSENGEKLEVITPNNGAHGLAYNENLGKGYLYITHGKRITVWERSER